MWYHDIPTATSSVGTLPVENRCGRYLSGTTGIPWYFVPCAEHWLLDGFVLTLTCVGFASGKAQSPEHPLGTILPSCQRPCLFEDFAAYWKQSELQMESIPSEDRERFIAMPRGLQ